MEFRQLRYFSTVAKLRSFSRASAKLCVAQSALSRQVQALEEELGVALLLRTSRGVEITPAGRRLEDMADHVLHTVGEIKTGLLQAADEPVGTVVVGLPPSLAHLLIPNLVLEAGERFPKLTVRIIEGFSVFLADWLDQGRIDFAVLTEPNQTSLKTRLLYEEDLVLVGADGLLRGVGPTLPFERIVEFPLVVTTGFHKVLEPWLVAHRVRPSYAMEINSIPIVKDMLGRGIYCSILPCSMIAEEVRRGELRAARLVNPDIRRRIVSAVNARSPSTAAIRTVEAMVEKGLAQLPLAPFRSVAPKEGGTG